MLARELPERRGGQRRHPDAATWSGFSGFLYDAGAARRRRRDAAHRAAGLRDLVHQRLPTLTPGRRALIQRPARARSLRRGRSRAGDGVRGPRCSRSAAAVVLAGRGSWRGATLSRRAPAGAARRRCGWWSRAGRTGRRLGPTPCRRCRSRPSGSRVSLAVGWALAVAVDFSPWLRRALTPLLVASQTLPIIAIAPLMIIWFGFGLLPKVRRDRAGHVLPHRHRADRGVRGHRPRGHQPAAQHGRVAAGQQFRYVRLPGAMPLFFTALRIGITYAVTGAIFAEYVGATAGLGIFMQAAEELVPHRPRAGRGGRHGGGVGHAVRAHLPGAAAGGRRYRPEHGDEARGSTRLTKGYPGLRRCSTTSRSTSRRGSSCP